MRTLKKRPIQLYIEPGQANILEILSMKRGVSKSEIIRESIEKYLKELPIEEDPAMGLIGLGDSGKSDLADKHDRYIARYAASRKR